MNAFLKTLPRPIILTVLSLNLVSNIQSIALNQGGSAVSVQNAMTDRGYAAVSGDFLHTIFFFADFGFEMQAVAFPERYDQNQAKIANGIAGFTIGKLISVNYVTSHHWRCSLNIYPFAKNLILFRENREKEHLFALSGLGMNFAVDFPNAADAQQRYRIGITYILQEYD